MYFVNPVSAKYKIADFNLINVTLNDTLFVRSEFKGGQKSQDAYDLNLYHTINEEKQSIIGFKKSEIKFKDYLWFINEGENNDNEIVTIDNSSNISNAAADDLIDDTLNNEGDDTPEA